MICKSVDELRLPYVFVGWKITTLAAVNDQQRSNLKLTKVSGGNKEKN